MSDPSSVPRELPILRSAEPEDLGPILSLLESEGLPTAGVDAWLSWFVVAETGLGPGGGLDQSEAMLGVAGLEIHGEDAILRSVVVRPDARGRGVGAALTQRIVEDAISQGVRRLFLLTTTAEGFFPQHGFRVISRDAVLGPVTGSVEFQGACPDTATAMVRDLRT